MGDMGTEREGSFIDSHFGLRVISSYHAAIRTVAVRYPLIARGNYYPMASPLTSLPRSIKRQPGISFRG